MRGKFFSKIYKYIRPENKDKYLSQYLLQACEHRNCDLCKLLIETGVDVNAIDEFGYTPLQYVCSFGNLEIYFPNYLTSAAKSYSVDSVVENNATAGMASLDAGLTSSTSAITAITLTPNSGSWVQYSTVYLYGVNNA